MINIKRNIQNGNIKKIALTLLASTISVFLVFPLILKIKFMKSLIQSSSIKLLVGITSIIVFILILTWQRAQKFWKRYKATKDTKRFPLIFVELLAIYLIFTEVLLFLHMHRSLSKFSIVSSIEFIGFVVVNVFILSIWWLTSFYCKQKSPGKSIIIPEEALVDEPITRIEQDLLRRKKFVDDLYSQITKLPTQITGSFTFGLYGGWGEGKTSVINLLSNKLVDNRDFLLIRFEPWYFQDEKAILTSFYNQIEKVFLDKFILPDFKNTIKKYQKAIATGISFFGFSFGFKTTDLSIEEIRERIERYIGQINRKIIIIIDDIDRLHQDEMVLIFKLVRKNTNFRNTIFLLSFDPSVVKKSMMSKVEGNDEFLEKIINKPIHLPAVEHENVGAFIFDQIENILKILKFPSQKGDLLLKEFSSIYWSDIYKLFATIRQAKRYINSAIFTLPAIGHEVNPYDFLLLEIIKIFNDGLYNDIWSNPWYYIKIEPNIRMMLSSPFTFLSNKNEKEEIIKRHVEKLLENNLDSAIFKKLLTKLFPDVIGQVLKEVSITHRDSFKNFGKERIEKWISHPDCFSKYFTFLTPSSEISDNYIEVIIDLWRTRSPDERKSLIKKEFFEDRENERTYKLLQKLLDFIEKIDYSLTLSIIEVIYENADRFIRNEAHFPLGSELIKAESLMLWLINDKIENEKIQEVIIDAVMNTPDLFFSLDVIVTLREGEKGGFSNIVDSIDTEYLQNQLSGRLKEYFIDGKQDIFEIISENEWVFFLHQWYYSLKGDEGTNKKIINNYVLSLVKHDAKKFSNFLMKCTEKSVSGDIVDFRHFNAIFSYEDFKKVAMGFKVSQLLSDEEKIVINKFLEQVPKKSPQ